MFGNSVFTLVMCIILPMIQSRIPSVLEYFPDLKNSLVSIEWSHATNSHTLLESALSNKTVLMVEADVIFGKHLGQDGNTSIPVMGHPPANASDLSLQEFVEAVIAVQGGSKKGIKLDFKSDAAFKASWEILDSLLDKLTFPVWLNADIIAGPVDSKTTPLDAAQFLKLCSFHMPEAALSLGWTTTYSSGGYYTDDQLSAMKSAITDKKIKQPITFAVRAAFAANSKGGLIQLINDIDSFQNTTNQTSLTIWMSTDSDVVDISLLRDLILSLGKSRVALDVPNFIKDNLNLNRSPVTTAQGVLVTVLTSVTAVFYRIFNIFH